MQVSFEDEINFLEARTSNLKVKDTDSAEMSEPVTLANLDKDCFIIPIANLDRFLPEGVSVSKIIECFVFSTT